MICSAAMKWLSRSTACDGTKALTWTSDRWTHQKRPLLSCSRPSGKGELLSLLLRLLSLLETATLLFMRLELLLLLLVVVDWADAPMAAPVWQRQREREEE